MKIHLGDIILDESIYPREKIDHKRVDIFTENLRYGLIFDPIEVQPHPSIKGKYRILEGVRFPGGPKARLDQTYGLITGP